MAVCALVVVLFASLVTTRTDGPTAHAAATTSQSPCSGSKGVGTNVPVGLGPGDLVAATDLSAEYQSSSGFPKKSRVWRILYVSTGVDETDLQLVCGLVAAPKAGPRVTNARAKMLTWAHGTNGVRQRCLPSWDPAQRLWGKTPGGLGSISWGVLLGARNGSARTGPLQHAMNEGWVVALPDYQPNDTYVVGKIAAANVLDSARAAAQLMTQTFSEQAPLDYDYLSWGYSQGGHAAMWAGQLAESYLRDTQPSQPTAALKLVGVALEAPASNFLVQPDRQPGLSLGDGLTDWIMHESIELVGLPVAALELQVGPALFSYIFGSWSKLAASSPLAANASFPAYPKTAAPLELGNIATAKGQKTIAKVITQCLDGSGTKTIKAAVSQYRNAKENQMLVPSLWNLPADYKTGDFFKGGLDQTCATTTEPGLVAWCDWVRWQLPGPTGVNPYPKYPAWAGETVPLFIAQGSDDTVIHCVVADGFSSKKIPSAANCMSKAFYDSLANEIYCPVDSLARGYLELAVFRKQALRSPASHISIPGQTAARSLSKSDLTFAGSPAERFISKAFADGLPNGCQTRVIN